MKLSILEIRALIKYHYDVIKKIENSYHPGDDKWIEEHRARIKELKEYEKDLNKLAIK